MVVEIVSNIASVYFAFRQAQEAAKANRDGKDGIAEAPARPVHGETKRFADGREFIGRIDDLGLVRRALRDRGEFKAVAIHGQGGVGKSALAEILGVIEARAGVYQGVWQIPATSDAEAADALRPLADHLKIEEAQDARTMIQRALAAMAADGRKWLLIHDNLDEEEHFRQIAHRLDHAGQIDHLITGRWSHWAKLARPVPLDELKREDASRLLAAEAEKDVTDDLRTFADEELGRLALAIIVAGADLRRPEVTLEGYRAQFLTRLNRAPEGTVYEKSVFAAVTGSVERLGADAQALLKLAAFMAAEDISFGQGPGDAREAGCFLTDGARHIAARDDPEEFAPLPPPFDGLAANALRLGDAVREAENHSLLRPAEWEGKPTRRIHGLTQAVLRDWMRAEEAALYAGLVGRLGRAQFTSHPQYAVDDWRRYARLAPHARALTATKVQVTGVDAKRAANFVNEAALYFDNAAGDLPLVRQLYADNLPTQEIAFGAESVDFAAGLGNLGGVQLRLGQHKAAEVNLIRAKQVKYASTEVGDPTRAYGHNSLGGFYAMRGRYAEAESEFREALRIVENVFGSAGELVGGAHSNLGWLYGLWAREEAVTTLQVERRRKVMHHKTRAVALTRAAQGERNLEIAIHLNNLAVEHFETGAPNKAIPLQLRAAAIPFAMREARLIPNNNPEIQQKRATLELLLRTAGREDDIPRIDALLDAEVAEVNRLHAEWERTGVHPEAPSEG
jgi:tetratricopeptide (TPR) repeat protein